VIRLSGSRGSASVGTVIAVFVAGTLVGAFAAVEAVPVGQLHSQNANSQGLDPGTSTTTDGTGTTTNVGPSGAPGQQGGTTTTTGNAPGVVAPGVITKSKYECRAGANGGATDRGVTANQITLATTIVASGPGASFLREMQYAIDAVKNQVNRSGGICGRTLNIAVKDDSWNPQTGATYLRNYIKNNGMFGIPVGASSEGLKVVIDSGDLDRAGFPVVGTDGLAVDQYAKPNGQPQPWVWPVATATASSARIMADYAIDHGAKNPGVVFDKDYKFGSEAAAAFSAQIKRRTGKAVDGVNTNGACQHRFCGIAAAQPGYSTEVQRFYNDGGKPDFVAMFLEPETALTWMQDSGTPSARDLPYHGAQPLFTKQFESQCRDKCDQMVVWSGFKPFIDKYKNDSAVTSYVQALKSANRQADEYNQFTESAYVGMQLLVQALRTVGPELTRARLKAVLDGLTLVDGLTLQGTLKYTPATRFVNTTMQAFTMQYKGAPGLWRLGDIKRDPRPQVD
jgi:ABC-type branched-subunit amino acid transport system substrate-binding protein